MTKFPHELPRPTSLITPPAHRSRRPLWKPSRTLVTTVATAASMPAAKPTAGFRCRAVAQLGNSVNLRH